MGNIVLLDELTINQIAAGEVIERPASVVKEMVENSIDAGAKNIVVEIKNGGISYIRVTDNGKGIASDDLEIAFERHATSKIRSAEDLKNVMSMGFRGEALASIASIANVELTSKTESEFTGNRIVVEGGNILEKNEVGTQKGTSIVVKKLFYNTPVRYKFLKKDYTEAGYIEDVITRIALSHPDIALKLISAGKTVIQTNGDGSLKTVIYSIYGKEISDKILNVDYNYEDIKITGVIGKPEIARSNRAYQMFFVNKRFVKDKTLSASIEQAYKGMLPIGKYGFLVLDIELNPSKVDVNVHPAKLEVRFEDENQVFKAIYNATKNTLLSRPLLEIDEDKKEIQGEQENVDYNQSNETNKQIQQNEKYVDKSNLKIEEKLQENDIKYTPELSTVVNNNISNENKEENVVSNLTSTLNKENNLVNVLQENEQTNENSEKINVSNYQQEENIKLENDNNDEKIEFNEMYKKMFGKEPYSTRTEETNITIAKPQEEMHEIQESNTISVFEHSEELKKIPYKFIGIAFNTYIILEIKNDMYILDQHAAHERILYEKVKKNYYSNNQKDSQLLLLPDIITLTHKEMNVAMDNIEMFEKAGFMLEEFGENTIKLSGVPDICANLDTKELFLETLDEINTVSRTAKQEIEERFIATVACKAAVKANMVLEKAEVEALLDELLELVNPFSCPHGRPTVIKLSKYEIERKFARK